MPSERAYRHEVKMLGKIQQDTRFPKASSLKICNILTAESTTNLEVIYLPWSVTLLIRREDIIKAFWPSNRIPTSVSYWPGRQVSGLVGQLSDPTYEITKRGLVTQNSAHSPRDSGTTNEQSQNWTTNPWLPKAKEPCRKTEWGKEIQASWNMALKV